LVWNVLRVEFEGNKTNISKLTYKCMRHENMKPIGIKKIVPLETIIVVLKL
jgi:hypothetical protein